MRRNVLIRAAMLLGTGGVLLQAAGCEFQTILDLVQTGLLGVTAAGAFAILQNV